MKFYKSRLRYGSLRFAAPEPGADAAGVGGDGGEPKPVPHPPTPQPSPSSEGDLGFPADTPIKDMTVEQKAAYFKHHSRRHEAAEEALRQENERLKEQLNGQPYAGQKKPANDTGGSLPIPAAEDALLEAEQRGADKYLPKLVEQTARAELKGQIPDQQIGKITALIDPHRVLTEDGDVDTQKISEAFAGLGIARQGHTGLGLAGLAGKDSAHEPTAGSVDSYQKQYAEQLAPKK